MQVQIDTKNTLDNSLETLANEIDELTRAADTNNVREHDGILLSLICVCVFFVQT